MQRTIQFILLMAMGLFISFCSKEKPSGGGGGGPDGGGGEKPVLGADLSNDINGLQQVTPATLKNSVNLTYYDGLSYKNSSIEYNSSAYSQVNTLNIGQGVTNNPKQLVYDLSNSFNTSMMGSSNVKATVGAYDFKGNQLGEYTIADFSQAPNDILSAENMPEVFTSAVMSKGVQFVLYYSNVSSTQPASSYTFLPSLKLIETASTQPKDPSINSDTQGLLAVDPTTLNASVNLNYTDLYGALKQQKVSAGDSTYTTGIQLNVQQDSVNNAQQTFYDLSGSMNSSIMGSSPVSVDVAAYDMSGKQIQRITITDFSVLKNDILNASNMDSVFNAQTISSGVQFIIYYTTTQPGISLPLTSYTVLPTLTLTEEASAPPTFDSDTNGLTQISASNLGGSVDIMYSNILGVNTSNITVNNPQFNNGIVVNNVNPNSTQDPNQTSYNIFKMLNPSYMGNAPSVDIAAYDISGNRLAKININNMANQAQDILNYSNMPKVFTPSILSKGVKFVLFYNSSQTKNKSKMYQGMLKARQLRSQKRDANGSYTVLASYQLTESSSNGSLNGDTQGLGVLTGQQINATVGLTYNNGSNKTEQLSASTAEFATGFNFDVLSGTVANSSNTIYDFSQVNTSKVSGNISIGAYDMTGKRLQVVNMVSSKISKKMNMRRVRSQVRSGSLQVSAANMASVFDPSVTANGVQFVLYYNDATNNNTLTYTNLAPMTLSEIANPTMDSDTKGLSQVSSANYKGDVSFNYTTIFGLQSQDITYSDANFGNGLNLNNLLPGSSSNAQQTYYSLEGMYQSGYLGTGDTSVDVAAYDMQGNQIQRVTISNFTGGSGSSKTDVVNATNMPKVFSSETLSKGVQFIMYFRNAQNGKFSYTSLPKLTVGESKDSNGSLNGDTQGLGVLTGQQINATVGLTYNNGSNKTEQLSASTAEFATGFNFDVLSGTVANSSNTIYDFSQVNTSKVSGNISIGAYDMTGKRLQVVNMVSSKISKKMNMRRVRSQVRSGSLQVSAANMASVFDPSVTANGVQFVLYYNDATNNNTLTYTNLAPMTLSEIANPTMDSDTKGLSQVSSSNYKGDVSFNYTTIFGLQSQDITYSDANFGNGLNLNNLLPGSSSNPQQTYYSLEGMYQSGYLGTGDTSVDVAAYDMQGNQIQRVTISNFTGGSGSSKTDVVNATNMPKVFSSETLSKGVQFIMYFKNAQNGKSSYTSLPKLTVGESKDSNGSLNGDTQGLGVLTGQQINATIKLTYTHIATQIATYAYSNPAYTTGFNFTVDKATVANKANTVYDFSTLDTSKVSGNISIGAYDMTGKRLQVVNMVSSKISKKMNMRRVRSQVRSGSLQVSAANMASVFDPSVTANGVQFVLFFNNGANNNTLSYSILSPLTLKEVEGGSLTADTQGLAVLTGQQINATMKLTYTRITPQTVSYAYNNPAYATGFNVNVDEGTVVNASNTVYNFSSIDNSKVSSNVYVGAYDINGKRLQITPITNLTTTGEQVSAANMPSVFTPSVVGQGVQFVLFFNNGANNNAQSYSILTPLKLTEIAGNLNNDTNGFNQIAATTLNGSINIAYNNITGVNNQSVQVSDPQFTSGIVLSRLNAGSIQDPKQTYYNIYNMWKSNYMGSSPSVFVIAYDSAGNRLGVANIANMATQAQDLLSYANMPNVFTPAVLSKGVQFILYYNNVQNNNAPSYTILAPYKAEEGTDTTNSTIATDTQGLTGITGTQLSATVNLTYYVLNGQRVQLGFDWKSKPYTNTTEGINIPNVDKGSIANPKTFYDLTNVYNGQYMSGGILNLRAYDRDGNLLAVANNIPNNANINSKILPTVFTPAILSKGVQFVLFFNNPKTLAINYHILPTLTLTEVA